MSETLRGVVDALEYLKRAISQDFTVQCPVPPPGQPTGQAQAAMLKVSADQADHSRITALRDSYIAAYGFDPVLVDLFLPQEPWVDMNEEDLDAVITVANLLGTKPEFVLTLWIMEGKLDFNGQLHRPTRLFSRALVTGPAVPVERVGSWMRSMILWARYGSDAYAPQDPAASDNFIAGPEADHDGVFTAKLTQLTDNGIILPGSGDPGVFVDYCAPMAAFSLTVHDGATPDHIFGADDTIPAGTAVKADATFLFPLSSDPRAPALSIESSGTWLYLQHALFFGDYRPRLEAMFEGKYGAPIDLSQQPWVTYLGFNADMTNQFNTLLSSGSSPQDAADTLFGDPPLKLTAEELDLFYNDLPGHDGITAAHPRAAIVKFLCEATQPWFTA
jgi:hypothetical protein